MAEMAFDMVGERQGAGEVELVLDGARRQAVGDGWLGAEKDEIVWDSSMHQTEGESWTVDVRAVSRAIQRDARRY